MYTLERLKLLNTVFDFEHKIDQYDVALVNSYIKLIESTRGEKPCPGDNIEHTDEYGDYSPNAHIRVVDDETGQLPIRIHPYVPIVCMDGERLGWHHTGGGLATAVDADTLTYIGKREKMFSVFGNRLLSKYSTIYFKATVNVWEYIAPDQKYPGYSTKYWEKQYISYVENPADDSEYHYYGNFNSGIVFRNVKELQKWKTTYKAVEFPGGSPNHTVLFLYREKNKLISRKEWDVLDLPLDTRQINGVYSTLVKVAYDDNAHLITTYRFTNSGGLDYMFRRDRK